MRLGPTQTLRQNMKLFYSAVLSFCLLSASLISHSNVRSEHRSIKTAAWKLVWQDEFSAANGSSIDQTKWTAQTGGNGWGNRELEYYTDRSANAFQSDG